MVVMVVAGLTRLGRGGKCESLLGFWADGPSPVQQRLLSVGWERGGSGGEATGGETEASTQSAKGDQDDAR